jgi:hypothetical protein
MTDQQIDVLAMRCTSCEQLAENEFLPLFCHLCISKEAELLPKENCLPEHSYIDIPFFTPLPSQLNDQFVLMLWLIYENKDRTVATWHGVFSVTRTQPGSTLAEKFTNYARTVLPQFEKVKDVICAKVSIASFKTLP